MERETETKLTRRTELRKAVAHKHVAAPPVHSSCSFAICQSPIASDMQAIVLHNSSCFANLLPSLNNNNLSIHFKLNIFRFIAPLLLSSVLFCPHIKFSVLCWRKEGSDDLFYYSIPFHFPIFFLLRSRCTSD